MNVEKMRHQLERTDPRRPVIILDEVHRWLGEVGGVPTLWQRTMLEQVYGLTRTARLA